MALIPAFWHVCVVSEAKICDIIATMAEANDREFRRRAALAQAALATLDPQRRLGARQLNPAYENDAREIAQASFRFQTREDLGLAIFKIFEKQYGPQMRKFDTFALAEWLLREFSRELEA